MMPFAFRRFASPFTLVVALCTLGCAIASVPLGAGFPAAAILEGHPAGVAVIAWLTAALSAVIVAVSLRTKWYIVCGLAPHGGAVVATLSLLAVVVMVEAPRTE